MPPCAEAARATTALLAVLLAAFAASSCAHAPLFVPVGTENPEPSGPPGLRAYKESHYRGLGTDFDASWTWEDFSRALDSSRVLFLGDHHKDEELHDRMLATLLRLSRTHGRKIALGLEAVGIQDELAIARYLRGEDDLDTLRAHVRTRWPQSWLDPGDVDAGFYRATLEVARRERLPVFGLEPAPRLPLAKRDAAIASRIRLVHRHLPNHLLVVIVGHAHLLGRGNVIGRTQLPSVAVGARMSRSLERSRRSVTPPAGHPPRVEFLRAESGVLFYEPPPGRRRGANRLSDD